MKSDVINPNSSSFESQEAHEVGGTKKIFTYSGSTAEALLDSASTAYADTDIVAYAGALDVSVPDGYHSASKILVDKITWNCSVAAGATMVGSLAAGTAGIMWAQPLIILPVATNYIYVRTTTAINHATNFNAGRYQLQIEYSVL